ncbi:MAG: single-stranded DNA-binding protein, partial [Chrysiogenales bacterium]
MASDLNKVIIIGRFTKDPELRYTQGGTSICSFSVANNRTYVSAG